ncbi:chymotrypsin-2-like [Toxorhynchites rutilus septentrionalis]|uniref:chymotrypsin-2-like n=1 Tax=Toxorhynchites rutilus septentrionalis TaxID=329112 RepID=UPI002479120B|nr:chymotrypsin-2-like [Toxorhynchites rutilus septentrionalis]
MFRIWLLVVHTSAVNVFGITLPGDFLQGNGRIVGGNNAVSRQFPFMASLHTAVNDHICGASILSERWLVTAGHCTVGRLPEGVRAVVGSHLFNAGDHHRVARIVNHPSFDPITSRGDVALVQTSSMMIFIPVVQPIALADEIVEAAVGAIIVGWGRLSATGGFSNTLQWKNAEIISLGECRGRFSDYFASLVSTENICTTSAPGGGVCYGDAGGPLVLNDQLQGIVSWWIGCGTSTPVVYTRVSSYREWILDTIRS